MEDVISEALPREPRPGEQYRRLEVDTFCVGCGYNLHSQEVVRDERLGIIVCRCPECGKYHPAGTGVTAASVWTQRSSTMLLVVWVFFLLFVTFWILMAMGAAMVAHIDIFTYFKFVTMDEQRDVEYAPAPMTGMVLKGTTQPVTQCRRIATLDVPQEYARTWRDCMPMVLCAAAIGFITGTLIVCFLWHWKKRRYVWTLLAPIVVAAFLGFMYIYLDNSYERIVPWIVRILILYALLEIAAMVVGIFLGRKIARGLLTILIPPKPRQHFAFLWQIDGKTLAPV